MFVSTRPPGYQGPEPCHVRLGHLPPTPPVPRCRSWRRASPDVRRGRVRYAVPPWLFRAQVSWLRGVADSVVVCVCELCSGSLHLVVLALTLAVQFRGGRLAVCARVPPSVVVCISSFRSVACVGPPVLAPAVVRVGRVRRPVPSAVTAGRVAVDALLEGGGAHSEHRVVWSGGAFAPRRRTLCASNGCGDIVVRITHPPFVSCLGCW